MHDKLKLKNLKNYWSTSKKYKIFIIAISTLAEIGIILLLAINLYQKHGQQLDVFFINNKYYNYHSSGNLKYYYELKSNLSKINDLTDIPRWLNHRPTYNINSDSLNERFEYSVEKPEKTFRILTMGDSFTFGLFVDTDKNYPEVLEDKLNKDLKCKNINKFEVINLGVGGYDLQYAAERFRLRGIKYNPDLVLWLLKTDDIRIIEDQLKPIKERIDKEMEKSGEMEKEVARGNYFPDTNKALEEFHKQYTQEQIIDFQLQQFQRFSKFYSKPLILLTYPQNHKYSIYQLISYEKLSQKIDQLKKDNSQIYVYDQLPDNLSIPSANFPDGHPNEKGYALMADNLYNYLTTSKIIPCD